MNKGVSSVDAAGARGHRFGTGRHARSVFKQKPSRYGWAFAFCVVTICEIDELQQAPLI
jgi:hypothetical protein